MDKKHLISLISNYSQRSLVIAEIEIIDRVLRLKLSGYIDNYNITKLIEVIEIVLSTSNYCLILDLAGMNFISSKFVDLMRKYKIEFITLDREIRLINVSKSITDVFDILNSKDYK